MKRKTFQLLLLFALLPFSLLAQKTVTGTVVDDTGFPLPGVTVVIVGTTTGTITDVNGGYSLEVPDNDVVLQFSFIGMETQKIPVGDKAKINVTLAPASIAVNEVVVTGLGIKREEKSLGYSVGKVKGEDMNNVAQDNVLNSLSGKVSGVSVNSTGASPGSSVSMVIRGASSLAGDNQPLFVIDGVPVNNSLSSNISEMGGQNVVDYGNAISDLNAADIESISILKGPSAAALYGSRAGNGVVLITTKKGKRDKAVSITFTTNVMFDEPYRFIDQHNMFASGIRPTPFGPPPYRTMDATSAMLGLPLDKGFKALTWPNYDKEVELVSHPDNFKNFVQAGVFNENNLSLSGGNEKGSFRVGFSNLQSRGVIPNSDFHKNFLNISFDYDLSKEPNKVTLYTNLNVGKTFSNNRPAGDRGANPLHAVVNIPFHLDIRDFENYWVPGMEEKQQYAITDEEGNVAVDNPYFLANAVNNSFYRNRIYGNMKLNWEIMPGLTAFVRYSMDRYDENRESKIPVSYSEDPNGIYGIQKIFQQETNTDMLVSYNKRLLEDKLSINASAGANYLYRYNNNIVNSAASGGGGLIIPGLYTISNVDPLSLSYESSFSKKVIYSVYGTASFGYNDMIYLDLTARNDWSSTLPKDNRSYFYPSVSLSVLLNSMLKLPNSINLLKIRGGWAQVGNDTEPYNLYTTMEAAGYWGSLPLSELPGSLLISNLKPEIANSIEFGIDIAFFSNRLRADATYYNLKNRNQILSMSLPSSSGFSTKLINAGEVESRGWDLTVGGTPVKTKNWEWDNNFVFTRNRTKINELADGVEYYELWSEAKGGAFTFVGEDIGILRDRAIVRVEDKDSEYYGWPLLDNAGRYQAVSGDPTTMDIVGNFNPNFTLGWQTSVSYKRVKLSLNFDWRNGGQFTSQTYRYSESNMKTARYFRDAVTDPRSILSNSGLGSELRDAIYNDPDRYIMGLQQVGGPTQDMGGYELTIMGWEAYDGVFNTGVIRKKDGTYRENIGGPETRLLPIVDNYAWDWMRSSLFDADFIKLREISLAYSLPMKKVLRSINFSVYSRNIILWTKAKINIDPENAFQPVNENGATMFMQGIERYNVNPWTIPIGVKLTFAFK
jgi:TonB-linked SusC/RagA family outer membrane protein